MAFIRKLESAAEADLPELVAEDITKVNEELYLGILGLADGIEDETEKKRFADRFNLVWDVRRRIIDQLEKTIDRDAETVQNLLKMIADENGDFTLPVPDERLTMIRDSISSANPPLDDGFVATLKAYMKKTSEGGLDGMVEILRVVLQLFCAERLRTIAMDANPGMDEGVKIALNALMDARPAEWEATLEKHVLSDSATCNIEVLATLLQSSVAEVVMSLPASSALQVVLAEYLNELNELLESMRARNA